MFGRNSNLQPTTLVNSMEEGIWYITLKRPEDANALSLAMIKELMETFYRIHDTSQAIRVVIITGWGKYFCAGADLNERIRMTDLKVMKFLGQMGRLNRKIESCRYPVIAAINGPALGGGLEITLACDIRIAKETAVLGLPEVRLGIIPGAGGTQRLPRLIGEGPAKELILTGKPILGSRAAEIGLVAFATKEGEDFDLAVRNYVKDFLPTSPLAVTHAKRAINEGRSLPMDAALSTEYQHYCSTFSSADRKAALLAWEERHPSKLK